jgi:hypothetical protein
LQWESKLKELDIKEDEEKIALKKEVRFMCSSYRELTFNTSYSRLNQSQLADGGEEGGKIHVFVLSRAHLQYLMQ